MVQFVPMAMPGPVTDPDVLGEPTKLWAGDPAVSGRVYANLLEGDICYI